MNKYFCRECGKELGYINYVDPSLDFTGSIDSYKFKKYLKHTSLPDKTYGLVSVFECADYKIYKNYIIDTANSGSVEIDDKNNVNLIWFANKQTGQLFKQEQYEQDTDGVKLVLHCNEEKIHPFPTSSFGFRSVLCDKCNKSIIV